MVLPPRVVGLAMRAEAQGDRQDHRWFEVSRLTDHTAVYFGHGRTSSIHAFFACRQDLDTGRSGTKTRLALLPGHDEDQCVHSPRGRNNADMKFGGGPEAN
jgi:hypothetical protein